MIDNLITWPGGAIAPRYLRRDYAGMVALTALVTGTLLWLGSGQAQLSSKLGRISLAYDPQDRASTFGERNTSLLLELGLPRLRGHPEALTQGVPMPKTRLRHAPEFRRQCRWTASDWAPTISPAS